MLKLEDIHEHALSLLQESSDLPGLDDARTKVLGRKSELSNFLRSLKDLAPGDQRSVGAAANALRAQLEELFEKKRRELSGASWELTLKNERLDVTRPGLKHARGHIHPISRVIEDIVSIFSSMGFEVVEGPEVETEYYNFDALNIPANHPARDMWDTFWLKPESRTHADSTSADGRGKLQRESAMDKSQRGSALLLRTHTSPVQVRFMENHNPPLKIIVPGRAYRYEATDASHEFQFFQLEGLVVDRTISIANFKGVIQEFFSRLFKKEITVRLRPSFFPFVEPGFEVDISCVACEGKGCSICKKSGWLELAGAGMVHQNVFKAAGYAPGEWQGFAFGFGIDRIAMMKYKIPDIRLFHSGDLRFLKQF